MESEKQLESLDRVTQNCLRNQGKFQIYNSHYVPFCAVDKSNIPSNLTFSCPYRTSTRMHLVDIAFPAFGCNYKKE